MLPRFPILIEPVFKVNNLFDANPCNMGNATGETCVSGVCNCGNASCPDGGLCDNGVCSMYWKLNICIGIIIIYTII